MRLNKLQERIAGEWDAAIISPGTNFYYLTGLNPLGTLERLFLLVVPGESSPFIIAPKLYEQELKSFPIEIIFWSDSEDPYYIFREKIENIGRKMGKMLIEDHLPAGILLKMLDALKDYKLEPLSPIISEFRMRKSSEEIELLKKAAEIVDKVFYHIIENEELRGMKEIEVAYLIESLIKKFGGEGLSFPPIVASGPNGANPHHTPGEREIRDGDLVIMDYGAIYHGYCSDITRTVGIGELSEEAKKVYEVVKEAQETAFQRVREGVMAKEIDLAARNVIESKGYGEYFIHRTGHGLGLDVHEEPYITPTNERILENGMVFTIEPGIYLPGKLGVRIEDDVYVSAKGIRLTQADRELKIL